MKELVIGATGFIGACLRTHLSITGADVTGTARRAGDQEHALDLLDFEDVPPGDIVYLCAGANGAKACEGSQDAFRVNVDATIRIAQAVARRGGFTVWISSMSVEWLDTAYQRQKLAAESVLRVLPSVGVVRAGRVLADNVHELCVEMARVGRARVEGVTRWGNDEVAYRKGSHR